MRPTGHEPPLPVLPARDTSSEDLALLKRIDWQYLVTPFYGPRYMEVWLNREGHPVSRKRVQRLMRTMGLTAIYRRPRGPVGRRRGTNLSLSPERDGDHQPQPSVVGKHHLHPRCQRVPVSGGHDGLVQPVRGGLRLSNALDADSCAEAWAREIRRYSTPVRGADSPARPSPDSWSSRGAELAWTGRDATATTSS